MLSNPKKYLQKLNVLRAKAETADFINKWKAKWDGKPNDKTAGKAPKTSSGTTTAPVANKAATASLFN